MYTNDFALSSIVLYFTTISLSVLSLFLSPAVALPFLYVTSYPPIVIIASVTLPSSDISTVQLVGLFPFTVTLKFIYVTDMSSPGPIIV